MPKQKIGQGKEGCVIQVDNATVKIMFPKGDTEEEADAQMDNEREIYNRVRDIDPDELRFVNPRNVTRFSIEEIREKDPEFYRELLKCIDTSTLPSYVFVGQMPLLYHRDFLTTSQKNYIRESIQILHDNGISHNDIHPQQIMFKGKEINPVIIDFGQATPLVNPNIDFQQFENYFLRKAPSLAKRKRMPDDDY